MLLSKCYRAASSSMGTSFLFFGELFDFLIESINCHNKKNFYHLVSEPDSTPVRVLFKNMLSSDNFGGFFTGS